MRGACLLAILLIPLALGLSDRAPRAAADHLCGATGSSAGPFRFTTYEAKEWRKAYTDLMELASFNRLFPQDPYFGMAPLENGARAARGTTAPYIPPILLKSIAWIESVWMMADYKVLWGNVGPVLRSHDCGYGIMQLTSGMQNTTGLPTREQFLGGAHYAYNIARGARILADKWNAAPDWRPVVGEGNPQIVEDWYFAIWGYNGFAWKNHPLNPSHPAWPRTPFSCGPPDDGFGHDRGRYPYQELVFGCAARPPQPDGQALWQGISPALPDLSAPRIAAALTPANFELCQQGSCGKMDITTPCTPVAPGPAPTPGPSPTPAPSCISHKDPAQPKVNSAVYLGTPTLAVEGASTIRLAPGGSATLTVRNTGTGLLPFLVTSSQPWLMVEPWQGIALGRDLGGVNAALTITADLVVAADEDLALAGEVRLEAATAAGSPVVIPVEVGGAGARPRPFRSFIPGLGKD